MIAERISGVFNYCDRWCERCPFQQRCDVFLAGKEMEAGTYQPPEITDPRPWDILDVAVTPEEMIEFDRKYRLRDQETKAHPIGVRVIQYSEAVRTAGVLAYGESIGNDLVLALAKDTARMHSLPITSKSFRAVHELVDEDDDRVDRTLDPRGVQSDGNGSAKVVRILIKESIDAWRVIGDSDAAGVSGRMIHLLEALDADLDKAFPYAMEFVRPGFDD